MICKCGNYMVPSEGDFNCKVCGTRFDPIDRVYY